MAFALKDVIELSLTDILLKLPLVVFEEDDWATGKDNKFSFEF